MTRPILIIEDDPDISESLKYNFEREGWPAITALTGEAGLAAALNERESPSLIILDLMLPGMSGTELCRRLRREPATRRTPIIMLTAKASESDRVTGLDLGADDYITKPFSVRELLARVRAVMRRMDETSGKTYEDDHLLIDFDDIRVVCHGQKVKLTNKEFSLVVSAGEERRSRYHSPATAGQRVGLQLLRRCAHARRSYPALAAEAGRMWRLH